MRTLVAAVLALATVTVHAQGTSTSSGQAYPTKPIRFIISFGPGSASDALARIAGQELTQSMGQPVVVQAKPGADGALSGLELKRAAPDGYTFLFGSNSALAVAYSLRKTPPYDPITDFTPITYIGDNTFFVVVHPSIPAKTIPELIAHAKARPNAVNYPAPNTYALVATALFAASNGIAMHAVPYKSEPDSIPDLLAGRVHLLFGTSTNVSAHVKEGRLRVLATTLNERSPLMPDVPTFLDGVRPAEAADRALVRARRSGEAAGAHRRAHEQGDGRGACQADGEGAHATARFHGEIVDARSARRVHQGPGRGVENCAEIGGRRGAIGFRVIVFRPFANPGGS
jgi:tripartite-type tricarboxylate transporter receptor subunit TctC